MKVDFGKDPLEYASQRPEFFEAAGVDTLFSMCMALAEQLAITNEKFDSLSRILVEKGVLAQEEIDNYTPDAQAEQARSKAHQTLVRSVFRVIDEELDELEKCEKDIAE